MALSAIILAAGKATRMKSHRVKVLHEICGRSMLAYVIDAVRSAGVEKIVLVVGHDKDRVTAAFRDQPDLQFVTQEEQKGTGHAVKVAQPALPDLSGDIFVLAGDGPLIRAHTLEQLSAAHHAQHATITLATCILPDPTGYGRIVRDSHGQVRAIVEQNDATPEQRVINEVNPSYYLFRAAELFGLLEKVQPNNKKGEYYLTDTLAIALGQNKKVAAVAAVPPEDVLSINSRNELADVNRVMQKRIQKALMDTGVTLISPENTWIEYGARVGNDAIIEPFCLLRETANVPPGAIVRAGSTVE